MTRLRPESPKKSVAYPQDVQSQYRHGRTHVVYAGISSLFLAIVKIMTGIVGHSYALVADGIESLFDVFGSLVIWSGLKIAARPPDANHPYGHGKAEAVAALIVALGLLAAAILIAVQSIGEIMTLHQAPAPYTLIVLVLVIIVKEAWFRRLQQTASAIGSTAVHSDAWHNRSDAITSLAAFLGISIALVGGAGYEAADDWFALLACGVIAWNAWRLFRHAAGDVMDESSSMDLEVQVRRLAEQVTGVISTEKCLIRKSGLNYLVDLHVEVDGDLSVREGHRIAHAVQEKLLHGGLHIQDVLVHIEPARANSDKQTD